MKVEKKVVGKEDLVVEVSSAEFMELLSGATMEFMDNIKDVGVSAHETIFLSLTVFGSMLLKKLFNEDEEEK